MTIGDAKFTLLVRGSDHKPLKSFPIRLKFVGETKQLERMTDQHGKAKFMLKPDQSIDVLVLTPNGSFEKNATINTTQASKKPFTIIGVGHKQSEFIVQLEIRMIDLHKKPVPNHQLEIQLDGNTVTKKSDQNGVIKQVMLVGEQIRMNCIDLESNLTLVEKFKKTLHVEAYPSCYTFIPKKAGDQPIIVTLPMHVHESSTEPNKPTTQHPPLTPPTMSCGIQLRNQVKCTRRHISGNHYQYGPKYQGTRLISTYEGWDNLISTGVLTLHEKNVICVMSPNEGNVDSVNAYDGEIVSLGAMQKTVKPSTSGSTGELPPQIMKIKKRYPSLFQQYLGNCGWDIQIVGGRTILSYDGKQDSELKAFLRESCNVSTFGHAIISPALESIANAYAQLPVIAIQIEDFIARLHEALNYVPLGYSYKISEYVKSLKGHATVLDQSVNMPGWVRKDFSDALKYFYQHHPLVSQNPSEWGAEAPSYEELIINYYGYHRRGDHMSDRYDRIISGVAALGATE